MALRWFLKSLFLRLGYDVRRVSAVRNIDPWQAMQSVFGARKVHTIFDVGAYVGDYTERFLSLFPQAEVYAFEPTPSSFQKLERRFYGQARVHPIPFALADYEGSTQFFINVNPVTNSLLPTGEQAGTWADTPDACVTKEVITVAVTTLDTFCQQHNISQIDILKVDAQGSDLRVLKGAERMLSKASIAVILLELTFVPVYNQQDDSQEIFSFLGKFGYRLYNFFGLNWTPSGRLKWCDALFVHHGFLE